MKTFRLGEWRYVDAGGNQLWREKDVWKVDDVILRHPLKERQVLSISSFDGARRIYLQEVIKVKRGLFLWKIVPKDIQYVVNDKY